MTSSKSLTGRPPNGSFKAKNTITSEAVMRTPAQSGNLGNNRHSAIPDPRSSAMSVATMASSDNAYRGYNRSHRYMRVCLGRLCRRRRQCDARSAGVLATRNEKTRISGVPRPVTHPRREARIYKNKLSHSFEIKHKVRTWRNTAKIPDNRTTKRSLYPNWEPACRSTPQLPLKYQK